MGMDDATWARHSNPLSGWSRISILPLMVLAVWSRVWVGWHAVWFVLLVVIWTWANPRMFVPPKTASAWMTKGVLGERIWLARHSVPIPPHHAQVARVLNIAAGLGALILIVGLWSLNIGLTLAGLVTMMGGKLWFLDRLVWIRADTDCAKDVEQP
ncbi:hypothetical protein C1J03_14690 [Sulfitobacter sp. SK012]|nr:hypothetical protein C1J03_14690 [Sulfitobacter sp. SK012]